VILILIITLITTLIFLIIFYNEKEYYKKVAISNTEIYWNIYNRSLLGESSSKDYLIQYDSLGTISISTKTNELEDCSSYYYLYESCETLNKITMSSRTASALDKIKLVISRLGLPNTLSVSLSNTNAIQGRIKDNYFSINGGEVSVEYTYSPKNGIFILFSHICELQCLKSSEGKTV
jgi:hypothetical protein